MLTRTRTHAGRLCRAVTLGVLLAVMCAVPAHAGDGGGGCGGSDCDVWGEQPGNSPGGGGSDGGGSSGCRFQDRTVPCTIAGLGWFNSSNGCYYTPTPIPPFGDPHAGEEGKWYTVTCGMYNGGPVVTADVWVAGAALQPPPDPEELARRALATITLKGADIHLSANQSRDPDAAPGAAGSGGLVHLPVWMWTEVTPNTWGPISASASEGGLTVTITAKVEKIVWNMGDRQPAQVCTSPGTPFRRGDGGTESPTCGHVYQAPADPYQVTATSHWRVDWSGGGQSGVIPQTRTAGTTVVIGQLGTVNR